MPHIDLDAGIKSCGSAEDYIDALYVFRSSIDEKADEIELHAGNSDWTMFRLAVHSLKSMARLVGARNLGAIAADMERRADNKDYNGIKRGWMSFFMNTDASSSSLILSWRMKISAIS